MARPGGTWAQAERFLVYLAMPAVSVWLYNSPTFHPLFAKHTPVLPPDDPNDDSFERAMEGGPAYKAARLAREKKAADDAVAAGKKQLETLRAQKQNQ